MHHPMAEIDRAARRRRPWLWRRLSRRPAVAFASLTLLATCLTALILLARGNDRLPAKVQVGNSSAGTASSGHPLDLPGDGSRLPAGRASEHRSAHAAESPQTLTRIFSLAVAVTDVMGEAVPSATVTYHYSANAVTEFEPLGAGTTDQRGVCILEGVDTGELIYRLNVDAPGFALYSEVLEIGRDIRLGGSWSVVLRPTTELTLVIIDAQTRSPIADAEVVLRPSPDALRGAAERRWISDAFGEVRTSVPAHALFVVLTSAIGYAPRLTQCAELRPGQPPHVITIELERGRLVTGRVTDLRDEGLAAIEINSASGFIGLDVTTDETGTFSFRSAEATSRLLIQGPGCLQTKVRVNWSACSDAVHIRIPRVHEMRGRVVAPAEIRLDQITARLITDEYGPVDEPWSGLGWTAEPFANGWNAPSSVSERGEFVLRIVRPAKTSDYVELTMSQPTALLHRQMIDAAVLEGSSELVIRLDRLTRIFGQLLVQDKPVSGEVSWRMVAMDGADFPPTQGQIICDATGEYELLLGCPGALELSPNPRGLVLTQSEPTILDVDDPGGQHRVDLSYDGLVQPVTIRVVGRDGLPRAGAKVKVEVKSEYVGKWIRSDASGSICALLEVGRDYRIRGYAGEQPTRTEDWHASGVDPQQLTLELGELTRDSQSFFFEKR